MTSLRVRLSLSYFLVVLIGMIIAAVLTWLSVEHLYMHAQEENLLAQARLVANALQTTRPLLDTTPYSQVSNVLPGIHTRIIEEQGAVVIDFQDGLSDSQMVVDPLPQLAQNATGDVSPQDLLSRPEIEQALTGQESTAVRRVDVAYGRRVLYAAVPILEEENRVSRVVYVASPLPDTGLMALPSAVRWQVAGAVLLALVLATGVGWWLARRIAGPLSSLARATNRIAWGDLDQTVTEGSSVAELRDLGRVFNKMTASLRQSDQLKTAFVADVSHELRTPLTAIKGTVETLQDGAMDDPEVREQFLAAVADETDRLVRLVNDLTVLTRADAGALNLRLQEMDLADLARRRIERLAPIATQRRVEIHVKDEANDNYALGDGDRIAQVLDNLLDNAVRHSNPGSQVLVAISNDHGRIVCTVTDTGPGIPARHQPFVFERFYRADTSRSRSRGGSGLGLSIAKALVEAHGGGIDLQSIEGRGTTILFWLPMANS